MERTMRKDCLAGTFDLEALTLSQRAVLIERLKRQAREARSRAIGAALLRLVRGLRGLFRRAPAPAARRSLAQH